jgi:hypothetical protein
MMREVIADLGIYYGRDTIVDHIDLGLYEVNGYHFVMLAQQHRIGQADISCSCDSYSHGRLLQYV